MKDRKQKFLQNLSFESAMNQKNQKNYNITKGLFRQENNNAPNKAFPPFDFRSDLLRKLERTQEQMT